MKADTVREREKQEMRENDLEKKEEVSNRQVKKDAGRRSVHRMATRRLLTGLKSVCERCWGFCLEPITPEATSPPSHNVTAAAGSSASTERLSHRYWHQQVNSSDLFTETYTENNLKTWNLWIRGPETKPFVDSQRVATKDPCDKELLPTSELVTYSEFSFSKRT